MIRKSAGEFQMLWKSRILKKIMEVAIVILFRSPPAFHDSNCLWMCYTFEVSSLWSVQLSSLFHSKDVGFHGDNSSLQHKEMQDSLIGHYIHELHVLYIWLIMH